MTVDTKLRPFPYHHRTRVLEDIAQTFEREGFDAGNKRAQAWGWTLIVKYGEAGITGEETSADLERFIQAWRAYTIPRLAGDAA